MDITCGALENRRRVGARVSVCTPLCVRRVCGCGVCGLRLRRAGSAEPDRDCRGPVARHERTGAVSVAVRRLNLSFDTTHTIDYLSALCPVYIHGMAQTTVRTGRAEFDALSFVTTTHNSHG